MPSEIVWGVVRNGEGAEWIDYGTLRPTLEQAREAAKQFDRKCQRQWVEKNIPVRLRKFTLTWKEGEV